MFMEYLETGDPPPKQKMVEANCETTEVSVLAGRALHRSNDHYKLFITIYCISRSFLSLALKHGDM